MFNCLRRGACCRLGVFVGAIAGLLAFAANGCGPDYKAVANVRGTVKMGKQHLTTGTVMFHNKDGRTASASILPDGKYVLPDAPIGECTVTVTVPFSPLDPSIRAKMQGKFKLKDGSDSPDGGPKIPIMGEMPKQIVPIPDRFSKPETSGLTYKVEKGEHVYDIQL